MTRRRLDESTGSADRETPKLSGRHIKTLNAVLSEPVSASIAWRDIEKLLVAAGCRVIEGDGSRVRFQKGDLIASFHRPHPAKEAKRYQVRDARDFLGGSGLPRTETNEQNLED